MKAGERLVFPCTVHIPDYFNKMNAEIMEINRPHYLPMDIKDRILFCDNHIIVINKPSGIICQVVAMQYDVF